MFDYRPKNEGSIYRQIFAAQYVFVPRPRKSQENVFEKSFVISEPPFPTGSSIMFLKGHGWRPSIDPASSANYADDDINSDSDKQVHTR